MSFLTNLILFSPLLLIGLVILYVLDRAESLRKGAGLVQPEAEVETLLPDPENTHAELDGGDGGDGGGGDGGGDGGGEAVDDQPTATGASEGGGTGDEGARSPISGTSGDEGFQLVRAEESEDLEDEDEEDEEEEREEGEEDGFEIVDHSGDGDDPGAAGPSNFGTGGNTGDQPPHPTPAAPRRIPKTKTVGAKKAASLARRDQRRAYNEFQRSRALAAAEEARLEDEARAEEVFAERQRRAVAEEEIVARREKERIARLEREKEVERAVKEDLAKLRSLVTITGDSGDKGRKVWKVDGLAGEIGRSGKWVLEGLEREGLLGVKEGECVSGGGGEAEREWEMRMVTGKGYYVIVREGEVGALFKSLDESGEKGMSWTEIGRRLEEVLGLE